MQIQFTRKVLLLGLLVTGSIYAATVSRITTFEDGNVLFASDLESEFDNLVDNINALDNDNIAAGANISPAKIAATIAGDGIARNGSTGILEVNDDNSTLEIVGDVLRVKDAGITLAKQANLTALSVIGNATNASATPTAITAGSDGHVLRRSGTAVGFGTLAASAITDGSITQAKLGAANYSLSSSCGAFSYINETSSYTDVTNLSVSITTTGRPVEVYAVSDNSGNSSYWETLGGGSNNVFIKALRGVTEIGIIGINNGSTAFAATSPAAAYFIDFPAAGTYTYKLQARGVTSSRTIRCGYVKLFVREL